MPREQLRSLDDLLDLMFAFQKSAVLRTALDFNFADHMAQGRDTAEALAAAEGANPRSVAILLDACCAQGLASKVDGRYQLAPLAEEALGRDAFLGDYVPFFLAERVWEGWATLTDVVRSGRPLERADSQAFWEAHARVTFGMAQARGRGVAEVLGVSAGDGLRILDVGCGSGGVGFALALYDPTATVTGVDSEPVLRVAKDNAEQLEIFDRVTLRAVDMFDDMELGDRDFDVAILSGVLPGYGGQAAQDLLGKVWRALADAGRVVIAQPIPDDGRQEKSFALLFAVQMLLTTADGSTYTFSELSTWLSSAGFADIRQHTPVGHWDIVVGRVPTRTPG